MGSLKDAGSFWRQKQRQGSLRRRENPEIALKPENKLKKSRRMDQKPLNFRFQSHPPR